MVVRKSLIKAFGRNVRGRRKRRHWLQTDLARRAHLKAKTISEIERGETNARLSTVESLALAFQIKPDELLNRLSAKGKTIAREEEGLHQRGMDGPGPRAKPGSGLRGKCTVSPNAAKPVAGAARPNDASANGHDLGDRTREIQSAGFHGGIARTRAPDRSDVTDAQACGRGSCHLIGRADEDVSKFSGFIPDSVEHPGHPVHQGNPSGRRCGGGHDVIVPGFRPCPAGRLRHRVPFRIHGVPDGSRPHRLTFAVDILNRVNTPGGEGVKG